jgi:hypothetical protein
MDNKFPINLLKTLSSIQQQYNPNNILRSYSLLQTNILQIFLLNLKTKFQQPGTGPNGAYVYLDENTGNMIVETINLEA